MTQTRPRPIARLVQPIQEFVGTESAGGIVLVLAALVALVWANSPWSHTYHDLLHMPIDVGVGDFHLSGDVHFWINDAAMVLFFFLVGLEIKRELTVGELNSVRRALVPAVAAAGGMAVPALAFLLIAASPAERVGWAVPTATDIAFALGVASLLGPRVPLGLKVFLLALAIFDDIGATIVIALFYGGALSLGPLLLAVGLVLAMTVLARTGVRSVSIYSALGGAAWLATYHSGVHPVIIGVAIGLITPWTSWQPAGPVTDEASAVLEELRSHLSSPGTRRARPDLTLRLRQILMRAIPPLDHLEHGLNAWVAFLIVPVFALANAGVDLRGEALGHAFGSPITWGVAAGLVLGKPVGILIATWLAVRLGAELPAGVTWRGVASIGVLAGIGFTVAIFVGNLAYTEEADLTAAKIGIFVASLAAGVVGYLMLRANGLTAPPPPEDFQEP